MALQDKSDHVSDKFTSEICGYWYQTFNWWVKLTVCNFIDVSFKRENDNLSLILFSNKFVKGVDQANEIQYSCIIIGYLKQVIIVGCKY